MKTAKHILSAKALAIGYHAKRESVCSNLSFDIYPGELICLMGSNGSGKSTLLKTLSGMLSPVSGTVLLDGEELQQISLNERAKKLSLVFTERTVVPEMRVFDLICLGRQPHTGLIGKLLAADLAIVQETAERLGLESFLKRKLTELSDGELQKVAIARALAQQTPLLLLDEPTAFLDTENKADIMALLKSLSQNERKTILLSTHDLDLALHTADRIMLLDPNGNLKMGVAEDLILDGSFESCFRGKLTRFDYLQGSFVLNQEYKGRVSLSGGDHQLIYWTRRALERNQYEVSVNSHEYIHIECQGKMGEEKTWKISGRENSFNSMDALLTSLRNSHFVIRNS